MSNEIIFEVIEDPVDGGIIAATLGVGINTEADTLEELRLMIRDAVDCHFHKGAGYFIGLRRQSQISGRKGSPRQILSGTN